MLVVYEHEGERREGSRARKAERDAAVEEPLEKRDGERAAGEVECRTRRFTRRVPHEQFAFPAGDHFQ